MNTHTHTHQQCDNEVKHVPVVLPESLEVVDPLQDNLRREDYHGEGVYEVEHISEDQ